MYYEICIYLIKMSIDVIEHVQEQKDPGNLQESIHVKISQQP